jgi:hypothetical protein
MLWKPEPPKAVSIIILADGMITVDGTPTSSPRLLAELLKKKAEARKAALQDGRPTTFLPADQRPREVLISIVAPEKSTYEELYRVLLACRTANPTDIDIEGVPMTIPPVRIGCGPTPPAPAWLPLIITGPDDLPKLQAHAGNLNGTSIVLHPRTGASLALVLDILRTVHASGGKFGFVLPEPLDRKETEVPEGTLVTIKAGLLSSSGGVRLNINAQFPPKPNSDDAANPN